jgi:hypothetical protein
MQQSSSSIGSLAAALAKAQIELVNPERSMVATIREDGKSGGEQIFRYAPLSTGLGAKPWANMRSPLCRQLRSIIQQVSLVSRPGCAIRPENGSPRIGLFAPSMTWRARNGWVQPSLMRGVTLFSHLWELPAKMTSTPLT